MKNKDKPYVVSIDIQSMSGKEEDDDLEELERGAQSLRDELNELDAIEKVDFVTKNKVPDGSKSGGEAVAIGSLLATVATAAVSALIPSLTNTLQSWLTRHEKRKIVLEVGGDRLELTGISDKDQQRLIDAWISGHTGQKI